MTSGRPSKDEIFDVAAEISDPAERAAYLNQICANDRELRAEIENLLFHDREAGSFLKSANSPRLGATVIPPQNVETPGRVVGPYKLLEQIGEGGFGIVFMADQHEPVRRKVAIKIIKPGMDSKQVLARFEAERHALAMMDHPNIARALDAGVTDSGRPYFVMELVRGVPITDYCDQHNLDVRQRLDLFVTVCHAVQHAHQKGIIHRDIKPSNVLVTMSDGRPIPKVIDFGVAKAINQQLTEDTIFTRFAEMIGTPLYMSPEQAEMTSLDIDTRSDIYSLGVLLYELLTGTTPFEKERLKRAAFDEIRRIIREDEPEKPSTRISTLGATSAAVSAHRHADPRRLSQIMRGDLDWIVMKALEKDRTRRYETANGLAIDIQRHLADEPVSAGPPSATYRFRKFARRNKVALGTTVFVSSALILCTLTSAWYAIQAREARLLAEQRLNDTEKARAQATENLRKAREAVDEYFTLVSENKLLDVPNLQPLRKQLLEAALRYHQGFAGQVSEDPQMLADLASSYMRVAEIDHATNRNDDAIAATQKASVLVERLRREFPTDKAQHVRLAGFWKGARLISPSTSLPVDPKGARSALETMAGYWEDFVRENPTVTPFQSDLAAIYMHLGDLLLALGQIADGTTYAEKARSMLERLARENPSKPEYRADLGLIYQRMADTYRGSGNIERAEELEALTLAIRKEAAASDTSAPQHKLDFARNLQFLGDRLWQKGDFQQSEKALIQSKEIVQKLLDEHPNAPMYISRMGSIHKSFASMCKANGQLDESEHHSRRMMELRGERIVRFAQDDPMPYLLEYGGTVIELANFQKEAGRSEDATKTLKTGIEVLDKRLQIKGSEQASPEWRRATAFTLLTKVKLLEASGQQLAVADALTQCTGIMESLESAPLDDDKSRRFLDQSYQALGRALSAAGHHEDSKKVHRRGADKMAELSTRYPEIPWLQEAVGHQLRNLAFESRESGEIDDKLNAFSEAVTYFLRLSKKNPAEGKYRYLISDSLHHSTRLLVDNKRYDEALEVGRQRIEIWEVAVARSPNEPKSMLELAIAHNEYGTAQKAAGRLVEAEAGYRKALALKSELVARWPNSADYRFHLAHTHQGIGFVMYDTKRFAEAEESFRTAHELFAKSAAAVPTTQYYRIDDGHALWHLGDAITALGRLDDAEKSYRESLAVFDKLAVDFPTNSFYRFEQGFTLWKIGDLLSGAGRSGDAEIPYRNALTIYAKLLQETPGNAEYRSRLARSHVMLLDRLLAQKKHADAASIAFALTRVYPDQWNNHERAATDLEKCAEFVKADESLPPADRKLVAENYTTQAAELRKEAREKLRPTSDTDLPGSMLTRARSLQKGVRAAEAAGQKSSPAHQEILKLCDTILEHLASRGTLDDAWTQVAALRLLVGDSAGYKNVCEQVAARLEKDVTPFAAFVASRVCVLSPVSPIAASQAVHWAEVDVAAEKKPWNLHILGLAHYRAGEFDKAVQRCNQSIEESPAWDHVMNWVVLAMAHHRLGHAEETKEWFNKAMQWMSAIPEHTDPNLPPQDWMELQVIFAEAKALVEEKAP